MEFPQPPPHKGFKTTGEVIAGVVVLILLFVGYGTLAKNLHWWPHGVSTNPSVSNNNQTMKITLEGILQKNAYIKGVAATKADVASGKAVFSTNGTSKPLDIVIPQYAFHVEQDGSKTLCIIVQAEQQNGGTKLIGAIIAKDGIPLAGLEKEFEFLGTTLPSSY